jgi:hypothetical protein
VGTAPNFSCVYDYIVNGEFLNSIDKTDDLGGTITYDDPTGSGKASAPIKNASINGKALSFEFDVAAGGMSLTVTISGEINGKSMEGSLSVPQMGSFPVKAKLSSPSQAN